MMGQGHLRWWGQAEQRPWVGKDFGVRNPKEASMTVEESGEMGPGRGQQVPGWSLGFMSWGWHVCVGN